jgi:AraC-like DNA-binding protein
MRFPKTATVLVLAGAVGIGSVAYGLGSQAGDGAAVAGSGGGSGGSDRGSGWDRGPGPGLDQLAEDLGVSTSELEDALRDFHEQEMTGRRDSFEKALADALGKSTEEVEQAFEQLKDAELDRKARRLARALNLDVDKVRAALDKVIGAERSDGPFGPGDFFEELAAELGVTEEQLAKAFRKAGPRGPGGWHGPGDRGPRLRGLADALDVTPAELRKAFREIRGNAPSFEDHRANLVRFLADRFNLSEEKVEEALPEFGGPGRGRGMGGPGFGGPGGPPGPGGPGGPPGFGP